MEVKIADRTQTGLWNSIVESSPHGTIFHTWGWLECIAAHTETQFYPLVVYNGTEVAALYPLFIRQSKFFKLAFSPPPKCLLLYLGPVFPEWETLKQGKKESIYIKVQKDIDNFIFSDLRCAYARIRTAPGIYDSRPLRWSGYSVEPLYTYRLDTRRDPDVIWNNFDGKVRANIKKAYKEGLTVEQGGAKDIPFILDSLKKRYEQQGFRPSDYESYISELYAKFAPNHMHIYLASLHGLPLSGIITVTYNNIHYMWLGAPKPSITAISPNDLIQWEVINNTVLNGAHYYEELESGDDPRTVKFKAKFNPETVVWFSAEKFSGNGYRVANFLRRMTRDSRRL